MPASTATPPDVRPEPWSQDDGSHPVIALHTVTKVYGEGDTAVRALDGIDLRITAHSFTAIMGASGSGKSTLLHCLAGLDRPTSGRVLLRDTDLSTLGDAALTRLRRDRIGFVFQAYNLVPVLSAEENMRLPMQLARRRADPGWFDTVVAALGLGDRLHHRPHELSGGQQQRVAIARAMLSRPDVVVADEPTGNLDSRTGAEVLDLLRRCVDDTGQSVVMVSHDPAAAARADRVLLLADGHLAGDLSDPAGLDVAAVVAALAALAARA